MDITLIGPGFLVGLMGSLHCIGMCGPLALALPAPEQRTSLIVGRLLYNLGRAVTYAALGALFGALGGVVLGLASAQRGISIAAGVAILVYLPLRHRVRQLPAPFMRLWSWVRRSLGQRLAHGGPWGLFSIGLLNGLLPCGMVWVALAGAVANGNALGGAAFMFLFGLGTLPLMLATSLAGGTILQRHRATLARVVPVVLVVLACWFILRGLGTGLPQPGSDPGLCGPGMSGG